MNSKTKHELIAQWLAAFPEDIYNPHLEQMAVAGHVEMKDGTYLPFKEWSALKEPRSALEGAKE